MRIVFFGTPEFAASIFSFLLDARVQVVAVVTQPDRPQGRRLQMMPSYVKQCAMAQAPHLPIFQPVKASEPLFLSQMKELSADLFLVVAFGQILPQQLLDIPPKGCINVHASLLPKYRGAAPMQRCLMNGDPETGICVQKMVKQLDAGDVIASAKTEISKNMTFGDLKSALCELVKPLILLVLKSYEQGIPHGEAQDHTAATYAPKILPEEEEIHWKNSAEQIHNLIRGISPTPGAWCWVYYGDERKRVKIFRANPVHGTGKPGQVLSSEGIVACGVGALQLIELQPEGKRPMRASDWLRGFRKPIHL